MFRFISAFLGQIHQCCIDDFPLKEANRDTGFLLLIPGTILPPL